MALINCPECKNQVSEHADTCPHCGLKLKTLTAGILKLTRQVEEMKDDPEAFKARMAEKRARNNPNITAWQAVIFVVSFVTVCFVAVWLYVQLIDKPRDARLTAERTEQERKNTPTERRLARIKAGYDSWDGAPIKLRELIKKGMNDPDSYKHDRVDVDFDGGDYLIITERFMGKNKYGGVVRGWVKAKLDLDGNILKIVSEK